VDVTVAICTWNRAKLLDQTLTQLAQLETPGAISWELLVIENDCTDETSAVLSRHSASLPLRVAHEPKRGLSHARNRAAAEARGEIIAWTDDDVLVEPGWLSVYARAARELPESAFFGGPVLPWFDGSPPEWISASLPIIGSAFALCDLGAQRHPLGVRHLPYGANFAVRTTTQRHHRFDPALGHVGSQLIAGDEMDVMQRMLGAGLSGTWLPEARVRHFVPRERMTEDYIRRYYRGIGRTDVRRGGGSDTCRANRLRKGLESGAKACIKGLRSYARRHQNSSTAWVRDFRDANIHRGRFDAFLQS
jgi:glycosyltransferase involved in cell wall biosynthesis